jgi:hypothetical protein
MPDRVTAARAFAVLSAEQGYGRPFPGFALRLDSLGIEAQNYFEAGESGTPLKIKTYRGARSGFLSSHRTPGERKTRVYSSHYPIRVAGRRCG